MIYIGIVGIIFALIAGYLIGAARGYTIGYRAGCEDFAPTLFNTFKHITVKTLEQSPSEKCHHCGADVPRVFLHIRGK